MTMDNHLTDLRSRIATVQDRIERARERRGSASPVTLVAVSKRHPAAAIRAAAAAGLQDFGENYAQELRDKRTELSDLALRWHFIGPLQRNKIKYVTGSALVHAIDRSALLDELEQRAAQLGTCLDVLVQVNLAGETQKAGIAPEALPDLLGHFATTPHVRCRGLMQIPPVGEPEETRGYFRTLARLRDELARNDRENVELTELSMGMTSDFEIAIEEGATIVRIGTAIFGARDA